MSARSQLTVIGSDPLAEAIRNLAHPPELAEPRTLVTSGTSVPDGAVATGMAMLSPDAVDLLPEYLSFNVMSEVRELVASRECGTIYGGYASHRVESLTTREELSEFGLLPVLSVMLALFPGPVERVWATTANILSSAEPDAWFVHIRFADDRLVTIEVLAVNDLNTGDELLVEITGSEKVLRVEPMRQSVWVERWNEPSIRRLWWEIPAERLVGLLANDSVVSGDGPRLRQIWDAVIQSSNSGMPVTFTETG